MTHASQFGTRQSWKPDLTSTEKQTRQRCSLLSLHLSALSTPQHCPQQVGHSRGSKGLFFSGRTAAAQRLGCPPTPPTQSRHPQIGGGRGRLGKERAVKRSSTLPPPVPFLLKSPPPLGKGHLAHHKAFSKRPSNFGYRFSAQKPPGRKPCLKHRTGTRRSNPRTLGDSAVH